MPPKSYQDVINQKSSDTKAALNEQKRKDDERKAYLSDRKTYERMKSDIESGRHANWSQQDKDDWLIVNKLFNSAPTSAQQKQADDLSSQMPLVPTTTEVEEATGATPEQQVAESKKTDEIIRNRNKQTTNLDTDTEEGKGSEIAEQAGNEAQNRFKDLINRTKGNYDYLNDYYKNSATNAWNELGKGDQKILLYDQLGTLLRNNAKYKPKLYGAFGNVVSEGQDSGDERSKLDNFLSENLSKGLERRNTRLDNSLEQQMQIANFPTDIEMQLRQTWEGLKMNNRAKTHLISLMKDVDFLDALKAGAVSIAANGQIIDKASGTILGKL